ncbi:hypothetical protein [Streptomyces sp. NPDC059389]|uniref:hypothetical protein n=1 Tax=Streptomyces sp. NPDC059389 TaxID=3346818 RepID=UPI003687B9CF
MDWTAPVSALIGGLVAVVSTYLADRGRWHRQELARALDRQRELYSAFLAALFGAREQIFAASRWPRSQAERKSMAASAVRDHDVYARRYQMELTANPQVRECTRITLTALLDYRNEVASGARWNTRRCEARRDQFRDCQQRLLEVMRSDLTT